MKFIIVDVIAGVVILAGLAAMTGLLFHIPILARWIPDAIMTGFTSAILFVLSGVMLFCIGGARRTSGAVTDTVLTLSSFTLALVMGTFLLSVAIGIHTGIEDVFIKDLTPAVHGNIPGRPSVPAAIAFVFVAAAGLCWTAQFKKRMMIAQVCGAIVTLIGGVAIAGYVADIPVLYYVVIGVSNPIAISSAVLFVLLGMGLLYACDAAQQADRSSHPKLP